MRALGRRLCRYFCGDQVSDVEERSELPLKIREASHKMSNAVMELRGSVTTVQKHASAFLTLVESLEKKKRDESR